MMLISRFFKLILSVFYPNTCIGCGEIIEEGEYLCDFCYCELQAIRTDKQCFKCGNTKKECECKSRVLSFSGCVSPFFNEGTAQKVMYAYKLGKRPYISEFFAYKMASSIKTAFYDIDFNGVSYVPLTKKALRKRGFNQSQMIAKKISEIMGIPLIENQLKCNNKKKAQHKISAKERFKNVKGEFFSTKKCFGNILLIDDIKTTGATLNECAKQLLSSGADSVYCSVGLITRKKGKK